MKSDPWVGQVIVTMILKLNELKQMMVKVVLLETLMDVMPVRKDETDSVQDGKPVLLTD